MKRMIWFLVIWPLMGILVGSGLPIAARDESAITFLPFEPIPLVGPQPYLTILCRFPDRNLSMQTPEAYAAMIGDEHPGLSDYWREVSYGAVDLSGSRVVGPYTLPSSSAEYGVGAGTGVNLGRLALDCAALGDQDADIEEYAGLVFVFNARERPHGGRAILRRHGTARSYGLIWLWLDLSKDVFAHEMGHAFGLMHSSADGGDYANPWDVMSGNFSFPEHRGVAPSARHPIAYDKARLGWIPAQRKFIGPTQGRATITLERLAQPRDEGYLMAVAPINGSATHFYTVEARRRSGYDGSLAEDAVVIHEVDAGFGSVRLVDTGGDLDTRVSASAWRPGMLYLHPGHGVAVTVDSATATGYVVTLYAGALPWPLMPPNDSVTPTGQITLRWAEASGADAYRLQLGPRTSFPQDLLMDTVVSPMTHHVVLPGGEYAWRVRGLPGGEWGPTSSFTIGCPGGCWQPSELVRASVGGDPTVPDVAVLRNGVIRVAWMEERGSSLSLRVADREGDRWEDADSIREWSREEPVLDRVLDLGAHGDLCAAWAASTPTKVAPEPARSRVGQSPCGAAYVQSVCWSSHDLATVRARAGELPVVACNVTDGGGASTHLVAAAWGGGGHVAWTGVEVGASDIYAASAVAEAGVGVASQPPSGSVMRVNEMRGAWLRDAALTANAAGDVCAIWVGERGGSVAIYGACRTSTGCWGATEQVSAEDEILTPLRPAIALDDLGTAYAAWVSIKTTGGKCGRGSIQFAMRRPDGSWSAPEAIEGDAGATEVSRPALAVTEEGGIYLVWEEKTADGYALFSAYRSPAGLWGPRLAIGDGAANRRPTQPAAAVDVGGNAYAVWVDTRTEDATCLRLAHTLSALR